jgi:hypothetical protein
MQEVEINSREELYEYLRQPNKYRDQVEAAGPKLTSIYYLIREDDGFLHPIYFTSFEDVFFESPCELRGFKLKDEDLEEYVRELYEDENIDDVLEYEKVFQKDGIHYQMDNPQTDPFLSQHITIVDILNEKTCFDWMMENWGEDKK